MIRVVHLINSLHIGGAERFVHDLVTHLDRARFRPYVICLYQGGELAEPITAAGIPVQVVGVKRKEKFQAIIKIWSALRGLKADILHAHLADACWYGLPAARLAGVPVRIGHRQNVYRYWGTKLRLMDKFASIFATRTVACSEAVRRFCQEELYYPAAKLDVIYNSVDLKRFESLPERYDARHQLCLPENALIVTCVALLDEQKGHCYLLEAIVNVRAVFPDVLLLLVGDGSLQQELKEEVRLKQLTSSVRFLGRRTDIPLILAASDVFVLASLWEGLPLALTEAAASGLPAVATRVDGIPEVVKDGITGFLVPPANSGLLAEAILALLHDPGCRLEMGKRAREFARDQFSISKITRDVELLYLSLLSNRNRARVQIPVSDERS
jgi:L-malate glycosyltransferase